MALRSDTGSLHEAPLSPLHQALFCAHAFTFHDITPACISPLSDASFLRLPPGGLAKEWGRGVLVPGKGEGTQTVRRNGGISVGDRKKTSACRH